MTLYHYTAEFQRRQASVCSNGSRRIYFIRYRRLDDPIIKTGGSVEQGLSNIFAFKFRIFPAQVITVRVKRQQFNNTAHCQSQIANRWLTIHTRRIN